jgi:hypothetical protein
MLIVDMSVVKLPGEAKHGGGGALGVDAGYEWVNRQLLFSMNDEPIATLTDETRDNIS